MCIRDSLERTQGCCSDLKNYFNIEGISYTDLDSMKVFFKKTRAMDVTRKDNFEITFPEFYELIKDYE